MYFSDHPVNSLSSFTFITSVTDTSVFEYIDNEIDSDLKNAIVVVKDPDEAARIQTDHSDMSVIPVLIGRISASIKEIEI